MKKNYDAAQLKRIDARLKSFIDRQELPGAALSITYEGEEILCSFHGMADIGKNVPIGRDTLYRVYSMSKVITVISALILYERGMYKMHDPISKYIPQFESPMVFEADGSTRKAKREIRIRDLFTMTSGITYPGDDNPTARGYNKALEACSDAPTMRELMERCARVPLLFDPGERWQYGYSLDVIGVLVEVLSGMTLGAFMRKELFDPLGMVDASFYISEAQRPRLARVYSYYNKPFVLSDADADPMFNGNTTFEMGGGGLVMTLADYKRITDLLVNSGTLDGVRILSRKTVDLMASPHLTDAQQLTHDWETQRGYNYGLGVRVLTDPALAGFNGSVGEFGWDGMAGTYMMVDRKEQLSMVFMTQITPGMHYVFPPILLQMANAICQ